MRPWLRERERIMDDERIINISFDERCRGLRLDKALSLVMPDISRSALQNATSIASSLLTTESAVSNIKEPMEKVDFDA